MGCAVLMSMDFMILVHIKRGPEEDLLELTGKPDFPLSKEDLLEKVGVATTRLPLWLPPP